MEDNKSAADKRITILVVHGVGEQGRFEYLESTAANLYKALANNGRKPRIEMRPVNHATRGSLEHSLDVAPTLISWSTANGGQIKANFREVHWADLDMPYTYWNWIKLVGWSFSVAGAKLFDKNQSDLIADHNMRPPETLSWFKRLWVRFQLFGISLLFLILLGSVSLINGLLERLSIKIPFLQNVRDLIFRYLGDVKLYQDHFLRDDERIEVLGDKSRVAIRRRMIRELIAIATDVKNNKTDGFYILAHSLGTVVTFNALMETGIALPNYLTQAEWTALEAHFKGKSTPAQLPDVMLPARPVWLDGGKPSNVTAERDQIDRNKLLSGLRGVLTMGSPLNKFAAIWPRIVPINLETLNNKVKWYNVQDVQDIVAGPASLLETKINGKSYVGGLSLHEMMWSDQCFLFTAHTSYWKAKSEKPHRLIDRLIPWFEGGNLAAPIDARKVWLSKLYFCTALLTLGTVLLTLIASLVWYLADSTGIFPEYIGKYSSTMPGIFISLLALGTAIILTCSGVRWIWEYCRFLPESKKNRPDQ